MCECIRLMVECFSMCSCHLVMYLQRESICCICNKSIPAIPSSVVVGHLPLVLPVAVVVTAKALGFAAGVSGRICLLVML